jgi:peptidoglycan-N-acetylglucosamine deacetylase
VFLTYDDGPGPSTPALLDLLAGHAAAATFFMVGTEAERFPEVARRVAAEGHAVGSHTLSHLARSVADHVLEDLVPGAIVLLHDSRRAKPMHPEPVIGAAAILLEEIERRGLRAVPLHAML